MKTSTKYTETAAGGVRTSERLLEFRAAGVTRVGATATKQILDEAKAKLDGQAE